MVVHTKASVEAPFESTNSEGVEWFAATLAKEIGEGVAAQGVEFDRMSQQDDCSVGLMFMQGRTMFVASLIRADRGESAKRWVVTVQELRGCLSFSQPKPKTLIPFVVAVHQALATNPRVSNLKWHDTANEAVNSPFSGSNHPTK